VLARCEAGPARGAVRCRILGTVAALTLLSSACTPIDNLLASVPIFRFMRTAPSFGPYEAPRPAPPGSVPFHSPAGEVLPPIGQPGRMVTEAELNAFAATLTNPLPMTEEVLAVGRTYYDRQCFVCHGPTGLGDGPILNTPGETGKFPFANNLTLPATTGRSDGYLYAVIRAGRGLMPAYGDRLTHLERWAIVNYVRQLQGQSAEPAAPPATPADQQPAAGDTAAPAGPQQPAGQAQPPANDPDAGADAPSRE
jgi:mono/diheme cytochrome c family protein